MTDQLDPQRVERVAHAIWDKTFRYDLSQDKTTEWADAPENAERFLHANKEFCRALARAAILADSPGASGNTEASPGDSVANSKPNPFQASLTEAVNYRPRE
jgi:hypothetical protein